MRRTIRLSPSGFSFEAEDGEILYDAARRAGIMMPGECGGGGVCGACRCMVDGREELACRFRISGDAVVEAGAPVCAPSFSLCDEPVPEDGEPFARLAPFSLSGFHGKDVISGMRALFPRMSDPDAHFLRSLASFRSSTGAVLFAGDLPVSVHSPGDSVSVGLVDLGTTSVKCSLADLAGRRIVARGSFLNPQRRYGGDLLGRINACRFCMREMAEEVWSSVWGLFDVMSKSAGGPFPEIFLFAGNTVMISILNEIDPDPIRRIPGAPVSLSFPPVRRDGSAVLFVPASAGFVGGDAVSGAVFSGLLEGGEPSMLIDLGTNGEVVLGCGEWSAVCSASAGPAFEGGGVKCGMPASPGAIDSFSFDGGGTSFSVIGGGRPVGICSSGLLSLVAGLFRRGVVMRNGRFAPGAPGVSGGRLYVSEGVFVDEDDLANLLRAKAAVFAAAETLLDMFGVESWDLSRVFVAGSLAEGCRIGDLMEIGLFPPVDSERVSFIGNSSLGGCERMIFSDRLWREAARFSEESVFADLASDPAFMDRWTAALFIPHTDINMFLERCEK